MRTTQWRLAGPLLRNAVSLIAVSRFEAVALTRHARLGDKPVIVIRNGGALPPPRPGTVAVPGRIVSSGRLERYKGHQRVIEALPYVMREIPEAHLLILGSGPYEGELCKLARHLGVSDRVSIKHVAPADRQGMATTLAESSVVAALSDYEAHPVAVMEALCVGRPVVGYDIAGIGELVAEGWVRGVPRGAPAAAVARELVKAMSSPSLVDPAELPTWDSCADQLAHVYLSSLGIDPREAGPCERETRPARLTAMARGNEAGGIQPIADSPGIAAGRCLPAPGTRSIRNPSPWPTAPLSRRGGLRDHGLGLCGEGIAMAVAPRHPVAGAGAVLRRHCRSIHDFPDRTDGPPAGLSQRDHCRHPWPVSHSGLPHVQSTRAGPVRRASPRQSLMNLLLGVVYSHPTRFCG